MMSDRLHHEDVGEEFAVHESRFLNSGISIYTFLYDDAIEGISERHITNLIQPIFPTLNTFSRDEWFLQRIGYNELPARELPSNLWDWVLGTEFCSIANSVGPSIDAHPPCAALIGMEEEEEEEEEWTPTRAHTLMLDRMREDEVDFWTSAALARTTGIPEPLVNSMLQSAKEVRVSVIRSRSGRRLYRLIERGKTLRERIGELLVYVRRAA